LGLNYSSQKSPNHIILINRQGSEAVTDFVNNTKIAPTSIEMLGKWEKLVMVGLFGGSLYMNLALIPLRAYT
jgi:alcohol dehydrogenase, propanol-preferring